MEGRTNCSDNPRSTPNKRNSEVDHGHSVPAKRKHLHQSSQVLPGWSSDFSFPDALVLDRAGVKNELSATQRRIWLHHPIAAHRAAQFHEPALQYRKLGVIRRKLDVSVLRLDKLFDRSRATLKKKVSSSRKPPTVTKHMALKVARADALRSGDDDRTDAQLLLDAEQIKIDWAASANQGVAQPCWDEKGDITPFLNDPLTISLASLFEQLKDSALMKDQEEVKSLYNGLLQIPVDLMKVLESLLELQRPGPEFYDMPMITCYPRLNNQTLEIAVYSNRLLFEIMTQTSLQCVMAAFDDKSYIVTKQLDYPPPCEVPVFSSGGQHVVYEEPVQSDITILESTNDSENLYAFSNAGFLKLCESLGTDTSNWEELSKELQGNLKVELLLHQVHGVCWMHRMEQLNGGVNSIFWEQRQFPDGGTYYYSPALGQLRLFLGQAVDKRPQEVKGGLLCDEMGLGKTVQIISLIGATLQELKAEAQGKDDQQHATLIIVPPALVSQWCTEIKKIIGDFLVVKYFDHKTMQFETKSSRNGEADIVVATYASLLKSKRKTGDDACRILKSFSWGRVVLDEMQEIRSSTTAIAKACEELKCCRRWMLSGTPMYDGVDDFRGELCFLRLEPFAGNCDDGFFDFAVKRHWEAKSIVGLETLRMLSLVMLRRSKAMSILETGQPLLGLKPLQIIYEPIAQDQSERAVYCFLESIVHSMMHDDGENSSHRRGMLRLLRDSCVSCFLIRGVLGSSSQLRMIDRMMIALNRKKELTRTPSSSNKASNAISCEEAIRYLGQVMENARVATGFVTTLSLGTGGGVSHRVRAIDSPDAQFKEAEKELLKLDRILSVHRPKRAKANWQRLLELITTGRLASSHMMSVSPLFRCVWKWRSVVCLVEGLDDICLPELLTRGWRPGRGMYSTPASLRAKARWQWAFDRVVSGNSRTATSPYFSFSDRKLRATWNWRFLFSNLFRNGKLLGFRHGEKRLVTELAWKALHDKMPHLRWTHPRTFLLTDINHEVDRKDIHKSFQSAVKGTTSSIRVVDLVEGKSTDSCTWNTLVQFDKKADYDAAERACKRVDGIQVNVPIAWVLNDIRAAKKAMDDATAEFTVYACSANLSSLRHAEAAFKTASLGLTIRSKEHTKQGHITCSPMIHQLRDIWPRSSSTLLSRLDAAINRTSSELNLALMQKKRIESRLDRLKSSIHTGQNSSLTATSAFESLQLLKNGEYGQTFCPVCLNFLGHGHGEGGEGLVAVTPCGHLFCFECFNQYVMEKRLPSPPCISCRKPLSLCAVKTVDPRSTSDSEIFETRREAAKARIKEAATILDQSNGQLPPDLWESLYLSIELPVHAHNSATSAHSSIPSVFLAHLNNATMVPDCISPAGSVTGLSSKIRALIADLPRNELSVVFTGSNNGVKVIMNVLSRAGIGCRCLFKGQSEEYAEKAVDDWKSLNGILVLVVQAGAAACGLTLTAASRMFILEPFMKHEEEKQAYARLHRYGQQNEVVCKVYFSPVTVESRLLEWRKREDSMENISYAPLRPDAGDDCMDDDHVTRFLLGA